MSGMCLIRKAARRALRTPEGKEKPGRVARAYLLNSLAVTYFPSKLPYQYRRRWSVSLPCSGWERVVPLRSNHQARRIVAETPAGVNRAYPFENRCSINPSFPRRREPRIPVWGRASQPTTNAYCATTTPTPTIVCRCLVVPAQAATSYPCPHRPPYGKNDRK